MFGKIMNRFYYGKSGQGDYEKENLPQTRMQLFWEMLRVRFSGLMRLNLIYMICWIPAMFFIARALMTWYSAMLGVSELQTQMTAGAVTAEAFAQSLSYFQQGVRGLLLQSLLYLFPCIAITGPFTAGLCYVTRNWARDEHAFIWSDFKDAVKDNWKPALLTSAITGFMPLLLYVCVTFYGDMAKQNPLFFLPQVLTLMVGAVWLMMQLYTYPQIVTYRLSYKDVLKNSLLMAIGRLPMTVGLKLLSIVPAIVFALFALYSPWFQYALAVYGVYYAVLGFALSRFVGASYTNAVFDKLINVKLEGVEINRGLYVEEDEEADEDGEPARRNGLE